MPDNGTFAATYARVKVMLLTAVIVVFFPIVGTALYLSTAFAWLRERAGLRLLRPQGFLFASAYATIAAVIAFRLFQGHLLPRFSDIYLLGIVLTAYRFNWRPAAYLFLLAVVLSAWLQPPVSGSYWLVSFAVLSVCSIAVVSRLKTLPAHA